MTDEDKGFSVREEECRELLEAGWEPVECDGATVWRSPGGIYLYPQEVALRLVREEDEGAA